MDIPQRLDDALKRLSASLEKLEAASDRRAKSDAMRANLEEELAVLQDDRSRLAVELDGAIARAVTLEGANEDIARRLKSANAAIRDILGEVENDQ
ncbi:conserved hypothetical protein [Methylocella silvestris BL2]|uniref:DUF4164 domain-containing protein n=2 Tax=Methylocella silvestris TaxID=199596 RepID=B8EI94_METSB|nr:DUF4164 domain-containing protein [Methylocella silvestris]ACK51213.1 conserved hypothetical protein [Methylocella silvestris BL2]